MRSERIVKRQNMRTKLKTLEAMVRVHEPLMEAQRVTSRAFNSGREQGFREGLEAAAKVQAEKAEKLEKAQKDPQNPNDLKAL